MAAVDGDPIPYYNHRMMQKKNKHTYLLIAVLLTAVTVAAVLVFRSLGAGTDFKRISPPPVAEHHQDTLEHYKLSLYKPGNTHYAYSIAEGVSYKGNILTLKGEKKTLTFSPKLNGAYRLSIESLILFNYKKGETVAVSIRHNGKEIAGKRLERKGFFAFTPDVSLKKKDRFTVGFEGAGAVLVGEPVFFKVKPPHEQSHVFIICADTLRADHLPTYGYSRDTAPAVHAFSKDAVVFQNAYASAPWTLPSHMSLFTALNEYNHGVKKAGILADDIGFLVEELSGSFATRSINAGVWVKAIFGFYRGFDMFRSRARYGTKRDAAKNLFQDTIGDLEKNSFPRSFYFLHTYQLHAPYKPAREFLTLFNPTPDYHTMHLPVFGEFKERFKKDPEKFKRDIVDCYDACIRTFDSGFERFIDYLKKKKMYDNAMIVFLSDHGEEFHDHGKWGHNHTLYNELLRAPLIIKFPANKYRGAVVTDNVGLIDVMPTILNWCNIEFDREKVDGIDLVPVIEGKKVTRRIIASSTNSLYEYRHGFKAAVMEGNRKILCQIPYRKVKAGVLSAKTFELYDLLKDPAETVNLYLREMRKVKRLGDFFDTLLQRGFYNLKKRGKKAVIDPKARERMKTLGYL